MSESDFIKNLRTVFVALKEGRDGYLSHNWYQEYPRECDFLVSLGLCKETHPAVGGKRLELADAHAAALASSKPSPAFEAMRTAIQDIMDGVAYTQKSMPGGRDVLLAASSVQVNSEYLIKARAALALAEKEAGTTPPAK